MLTHNVVTPEKPDWFLRKINQGPIIRAKVRTDPETRNVDYEFRMYYLYQGRLYEATFITWEQKSGGLPGTAETYFNFRQPLNVTLQSAATFVTDFWQGTHNRLWMYDAQFIVLDNKGANSSWRLLEGESRCYLLSCLLQGFISQLCLLLYMSDNDMHKHCYQFAKQTAEACLANL